MNSTQILVGGAAPVADPLPWLTAQMRAAGAFDQADPAIAHRVLLDTLTSAVSAMSDQSRPYRVVLSASNGTASTALTARLIEVGSRPWNDQTLTDGQRAAVMAGLVLHEVGHVNHAHGYQPALAARGVKMTGAVAAMSNIAADLHDETAVAGVFVGLAPALAVTLWWVNRGPAPVIDLTTVAGRVNAALAASRWPALIDWDAVTDGRDWAAFWADWAGKCIAGTTDADHATRVIEAMDKIRDLPPVDEDPTDDGDDTTDETTPDPDGDPTDGRDLSDDQDDDTTPDPHTDDEPAPDADDDDAADDDDDTTDGGDQGLDADDQDDDAGEPNGEDGDDDADQDDDAERRSEDVDVTDACAGKSAKDPADRSAQDAVDAILESERTGSQRRTYVHTTSKYAVKGGRLAIIQRRPRA